MFNNIGNFPHAPRPTPYTLHPIPMPPVTPSQVASLRARTGVGMMAVKSALEEANGDEEKAIEILKKRGEAQAIKKSARDQKEGGIAIASENGKSAIVHLACETDFVARGDDFQKALNDIAAKALEEGADAAKAYASAMVPEMVNKLGENISLSDVKVVAGLPIGTYVHTNGKIGVIVALTGGDETKARDTAMHAAAMAPTYVNPEDVPTTAIEKEKEYWREELKRQGKPEPMWEKIMMGKERKFREENALVKQPFAKDQSVSIEKYLAGAKVTAYVRMAV